MATTLYATVPDLILSLQGTDQGTGTPAELDTPQLTLALQAASNRVSVYFGTIMDSTVPQAVPPDIFHDLTLDLGIFFAWRTYLKGKAMPVDHPAYLAYQNAMNMLEAARKGELRLDPANAGGINQETGLVINRIPPVFTGDDSNTRRGWDGTLEADSPFWTPQSDGSPYGGGLSSGGAVYQG
jgi:hypothetical protein